MNKLIVIALLCATALAEEPSKAEDFFEYVSPCPPIPKDFKGAIFDCGITEYVTKKCKLCKRKITWNINDKGSDRMMMDHLTLLHSLKERRIFAKLEKPPVKSNYTQAEWWEMCHRPGSSCTSPILTTTTSP